MRKTLALLFQSGKKKLRLDSRQETTLKLFFSVPTYSGLGELHFIVDRCLRGQVEQIDSGSHTAGFRPRHREPVHRRLRRRWGPVHGSLEKLIMLLHKF